MARAVQTSEAHRAIEAVWRIESARLIAGLTRIVARRRAARRSSPRTRWSPRWSSGRRTGVPDNPGAWLMATAQAPRDRRAAPPRDARAQGARSWAATSRPPAGGARSRGGRSTTTSATTCCGWSSSPATRCSRPRRGSRSPCGCSAALTTDEIARAFLVPEATVAQRIVRAKKTLADAHVPFEVPARRAARGAAGLRARGDLPVFNEGYAATAGEDWMRPELCQEALRLGRILAELHAGRAGGARARRADGAAGVAAARARIGPAGEPVLLLRPGPGALGPAADRPRARRARARASARPARRARTRCRRRSPPATRAPRRRRTTDWARIAALYAALAQLMRLARGRAQPRRRVSMALGPAAGLELVDELRDEPALADYHLSASVRGDLLEKLGRLARGARRVRARGRDDPQRARARRCCWPAPLASRSRPRGCASPQAPSRNLAVHRGEGCA